MKRIDWLDHLKAFAIFLVVYGHSWVAQWGIKQWIYAFHMPLFFLISGFLLKRPEGAREVPQKIVQQVKSLGPPYLFFSLLGYVLWFFVARHVGEDKDLHVSPWLTFLAIPYGTGTPALIHLQPEVLWFFPCLFLCQVFVICFAVLKDRYLWLVSVLLAIVGFLLPQGIALPFELETALVAQLFVTIGFFAKKWGWMDHRVTGGVALPMVLIVGGSIFAMINSPVDMRTSRYGNVAWFLGSSLMISSGLALFVSGARSLLISRYVSENTVAIFPLHVFVFKVMAIVATRVLGVEASLLSDPIVALVASVLNCAFIVLCVAPVLRSWFPFVYGIKMKRPADNGAVSNQGTR